MLRPEIESLAAQWRGTLFTNDTWERDLTRPSREGVYGGYFARAPSAPFGGYVKPTKPYSHDMPQAATEKIVADLAFELDLPVSPVLLYKRPEALAGEEWRCCVSLVCAPTPLRLQEVAKDGVLPEWVYPALRSTSGLMSFLTYVEDRDSGGGKHVLVDAAEIGKPDANLYYIDHASALGDFGGWDNEGWHRRHPQFILGPWDKTTDRQVVQHTIDRISKMTDAVIEEIVLRIPDDYMSAQQRTIVEHGLKGRRAILQQIIDEALK